MKIRDFFINYKLQLIVLAIILCVFNFMLLLNGAFPYGGKTLLVGDSFALVGMLFEHIFDWFAGETSLFFNAKLGGGVEIFSTLLYMVFNPFFLLVLPFGKANIFKSFNFVIFALLVFTAIIAMWFLKKHFKNISKFMFVLLVLTYTFSSYFVLSLCSINWFIFPSVILIVFDRFIELENNGKIWGFSLSIFWLVISSFVVGVAANILLLIVFVLHIFLTKTKEEQKEICVKLLCAYVIAILLSVCVMLPALIAILKTDRAGSIFSVIFSGEFSGSFMHKLACLCLDISLIIFAIYYLVVADKKSKEFKFYISTFIVLLIPSIFDASLSLLFGGYYSGFPARLQFLNIAFMFVIVCNLFNEKNILAKQENEEKSSKLFFGLYVFMFVLFMIAILFFGGFQLTKVAVSIKDPLGGGEKLYRAIVLIFAVVTILFVASILGAKRKVLSRKVFRFSAVFVMVFSLVVNVLLFSFSSNTNITSYNTINAILNENKLSGKVKTKEKELEGLSLQNKIFAAGSLNYFSSTIAPENTAFSNLGYYSSPVNIFTENGTLVADSLVGLKYYITKKKEDRPYLKLIDGKEEVYLYENTLASTGAVLFNKNIDFKGENAISIFENLSQDLCDENPLFESVTLEKKQVSGIDSMYADNVYKCTFIAPYDGILYLEDMCLFEQFNSSAKDYISKKVDSVNIYTCKNYSAGQTDLGYANAGEEMVVYLTDVENINDVKFTFLNYSNAEKLCTKFKENQANFEYTKNGYNISGNSTSNQNLVIFMSNINGIEHFLNDNNIKVETILDGFALIDVDAGDFEVVAMYKYPNTIIWIVTIIVCIVLLIAVVLVYKFTGFKHIKTFARGLFLSAGAIMLSVFVFFGIVLTFFKLIL